MASCKNEFLCTLKLSAQRFPGSFRWTSVTCDWLIFALSTQTIPGVVAPKARTHFLYSFWSGELRFISATRLLPPFIPIRLTAPGSQMHYRAFSLTWLCKFIGKKESVCIRKEKEKERKLPQDWFGTPTWPPFHCFGTPIWPP